MNEQFALSSHPASLRVEPESAGFSSPRLARLHTAMQRYVDDRKLPGLVTLVARRHQVVHLETFGLADVEAGEPMRADTLFRIYSMTKPITSVAVLMLVEEGLLRLTDPISAYIPAFKDVKVLYPGTEFRTVEPARPITILDLLTHTAGLSYGYGGNDTLDQLYRERVFEPAAANPEITLQMCVEAAAGLPLAFQPGAAFLYSFATDVLGYLVQVLSGAPFDQFLRQRIFEPLGMPDTDFWAPPDKVGRLAASYYPGGPADFVAVDSPKTSPLTRPTRNPSGGSGLISTIGDYLRFARLLLNRGELDGVRLLGRKTVELMTANHLPAGVRATDELTLGAGLSLGQGFGLGVSVLTDLGQSPYPGSVGMFGWSGAANTNFWVDPREGLIGILMVQFMLPPVVGYPVMADFRNLVYQALVD